MAQTARDIPQIRILCHVLASRTGTQAEDWFPVYKARYGMQVLFRALREERGSGAVLTQLLTCCTSIDPILTAGLTPRYADISQTTFAIDPNGLTLDDDVVAVVDQHTHGIIDPVADARLAQLAHDAGALFVEDSAHCAARLSVGEDGLPLGDVSIHSFGPEKSLHGSYFGGAIWVNPRMADEALRTRMVAALSALEPIPYTLDRVARAYRNEMRVFTRVPSRLSAAMRETLAQTGAFDPPVAEAERKGTLPLKPYAPSAWVAERVTDALANLDQNEACRRACVAAYVDEFGKALKDGVVSPELLPTDLDLLAGQPLLHFPVALESTMLAERVEQRISELGYYAVPWYRPLIFPGVDGSLYFWDGDESKVPTSARLSAGALALPTDVDEEGARAVARTVVSLAALPAGKEAGEADADAPTAPANLALIHDVQDVRDRLVPVIVGGDLLAYCYGREFFYSYGIKPIVLSSIDIKITSSSSFVDYRIVPNMGVERAVVDYLLVLGRELAAQGKVGMALGLADWQVRVLSSHKDELSPWYVVPYIDFELLDDITQKDRFYAICEELGIAYPKTWELDCAEKSDDFDATAYPYPLIAKPSNSASWEKVEFEGKRKIYELQGPEELSEAYAAICASDYQGKLILQDFVPGGDDAIRSLTTFSDAEGNLRVVAGGRVALQDHSPHALGNPVCILSEKVDRIVEDAAKFLKATGYRGYANFNIKYDDRDGSYRFFEVNTRPGRNTYYVTLGGISFVRPIVDEYVLGREVSYREAYAPNLYTIVPASVAESYVADPALREQVLACYWDGRAHNPLTEGGDNVGHKAWARLFTQNQARKFKKYMPSA
ncbi:MAG: DegT/DnrJ/EryC1/StrS family aminotransferase [Atopobiaceae bacterium]|nr:DegT/DnrJ/EryC1/StrS family aminotransferase [Atopobiaceae bacterium]